METLSITPNGAEKSTAKHPCVSKDWGEAEEEEGTASPANKGGAASDGKTEIQMLAVVFRENVWTQRVKVQLTCLPSSGLNNCFIYNTRNDYM